MLTFLELGFNLAQGPWSSEVWLAVNASTHSNEKSESFAAQREGMLGHSPARGNPNPPKN